MYIYLYVAVQEYSCICIYAYTSRYIRIKCYVLMQANGCAVQLGDGSITMEFDGNYVTELANGGI